MDVDLQDTLVALESGVANISPEAALANVDGWRTRLEGWDVPHADEIRGDLAELSLRLARGDLKDVGELLARLGNELQAATNFAPSDVREDLARLAEALNRAGLQAV